MSLDSNDCRIQIASFERLMDMIKFWSELKKEFQNQIFIKVVQKLLLTMFTDKYLEVVSTQINKFDDILYYFYKNSAKLLESKPKCNLVSFFALLSALKTPVMDQQNLLYFADYKGKLSSRSEKAYSECWISFLSNPLPAKLYASILERLDEQVLPNLKEPTLLMDFYVDAYNTGNSY